MDKHYWDNLAGNFKQDVFEVFKNDANGTIARAIQTHSSENQIATDIGCGVGSLLPMLAKSFGKVYGVDISPKCLKKAEKNCSKYSNITYIDQDLSKVKCQLPKSDFLLCVNALIFPSLPGRINFLNACVDSLNKNGVLLLVVPSLESALLRNHREVEWNIKAGEKPHIAQKNDFVGLNGISAESLALGSISIDGIETKHFLKEEIYLMLEKRGLTILDIAKLEYPWKTEFFNPPKWMQAPYPWDWFCLAKKR